MVLDGPQGPQLQLLSEIRYEIERLNEQFTQARLGIQVQPEFSTPHIEVLPAPVILPPTAEAPQLDLSPLLSAVGQLSSSYAGGNVGLIAMLDEIKQLRKDIMDLINSQRNSEAGKSMFGIGASVVTVQNSVPVKNDPGGGALHVTVDNGVSISSGFPALQVLDVITASNVNIGSAGYTATSAVGVDYFLCKLTAEFTTNAARSIVVSDTTGNVLFSESANTDTQLVIDFERLAYDQTDNITVTIGQASGACTLVELTVSVETGTSTVPLGGNPVLGPGSSNIGTVNIAANQSVNVGNFGFVLDPNNSTTTPLLANAVFTGAATDLSNYASVTYGLYADPDQMSTSPTLTFEFSDDATNWDIQVPSTVYSGHVFIPVPLRPVKRYMRLVYQNGNANQNTFRLTTYLHRTVPQDLARTGAQVLQAGDAMTVSRTLVEPSFKGSISILGADRSIGHEAVTGEYIVIDRAQFDVPFANSNITSTVSGTGSTSQAASTGAVIAVTGAGAGSANLSGPKKLNYIPGRESREEFSVAYPASCPAGGDALVGMSSTPLTPIGGTANSLLVGYVGTTFGFHIVSGGTITTIPKSQWNGDPFDGSGLSEFRSGLDPVPLDITKGNAWRIRYVYYGIGPVYVEVKSPDDIWVVAHTYHYPNTAIVPYIQSPNLYMCWDVTTTSTPAAVSMRSWSSNCGIVTSPLMYQPHEVGGHFQVQQAVLGDTTAGNTTVYSVPSGRQLFVTAIWCNLLTVSQHAGNGLQITDGAGGTVLYGLTGSTNNGAIQSQSTTFPVPLVFTNAFVANLVVAGGSMSADYGFVGYHKEL